MIEKKVFILDSRLGKVTKYIMEIAARGVNQPCRIDVQESPLTTLPRDYDIYIIHYRDLGGFAQGEDDLRELRREQPWSLIVGSGQTNVMPKDILEKIDLHIESIGLSAAKQMIAYNRRP